MKLLASRVSKAICDASGMILRRGDGTMSRSDLGFLTRTNIDRAILLEVCFVNSRTDVRLYQENFDAICHGIAEALVGKKIQTAPAEPPYFQIEEENIRRLVELGVIDDPGYWQEITHIRWLNGLLRNAGVEGRLDRRIENGISDLQTSMPVLEDAGITNSPDHWRNLAQSGEVKNLSSLLISMANISRIVLEKIY